MKGKELDAVIEVALKEDMPRGDITSENIIPPDSESEAIILAKEQGILAGIKVAGSVFGKIDPSIRFKNVFEDGQIFKKGDILARLKGNSISILKGERTALNFLQRMSGIATTTWKFVRILEGTHTKILDTRKTTPGLRFLEKYAVKMGGGVNHRFNLSDMVLIKDNHLKLVGGIQEAVRRAKKRVKKGIKVEVETTSLEDVKEAVQSGADMVMLDNMPLEKIGEVVKWVKGTVPLEVSGKVTLRRVKEIASLGIDFISVGSLTHSYRSVDISVEFLD
ncbi:MAG: nicotinate-nucleotide pyrophosphorylase [candidate division Zixibacteria bacterium SM23_73]|nr:MAG: nicotinate-nucleotide pyrophosphorylase [candidate division Zixibacteria bacterium SM23_73]